MIPVLLAPARGQAWLPHAGTSIVPETDPSVLADDVQMSRWLAEWEPMIIAQANSAADVSALVARETAVHDACLMLGLAIDDDVDAETRLEIAADLDEMLDDSAFARDFSALWHSRQLSPTVVDALGDLAAACTDLHRLKQWLSVILRRQPLISELCTAWDLIPASAFMSRSRSMLRDHCRMAGYFLDVAESVEDGAVEAYLAERIIQPNLPATANARVLFTKWITPFRHAHHSYEPVEDEHDRPDDADEDSVQQRRYRLSEVRTHIDERKDAIKHHLDHQQSGKVQQEIQWLRDYQLARGGPAHFAKSLCDLAAYARKQGSSALALKWAEEAEGLSPDDPVTHNERAECLRELGRVKEALAVYEQTRKDHPANSVVHNGYAECLRELGQVKEALVVYEQTRKEHPANSVAQNGYAECLRELGRVKEALVVYEQTRKDHPSDPFAHCGYAECLRELGRVKEALVVYEQTRKDYPTNPVAHGGYAECLRELGRVKEALGVYEQTREDRLADPIAHCGYAECLRELERFDEALAILESVIKMRPHNRVAKNARASLLSQMGRHQEGLDSLPSVTPTVIQDWRDVHLRGMILLRMARAKEAEKVFRSAADVDLPSMQRSYFNAGLALCRIRQKKYTEAVQHLEGIEGARRLETPVAVILAHALAASDRMAESRQILDALPTDRRLVADVSAEIRHRYFDRKPEHDENWLVSKESDLVLCA
ncbi:MAG TPA: tetratricopeptide repeat protein [Prosthecobacter sp.]|nr:tetratricopeptide repeat protein [Prosthecobacter sp.]